MSQEARAAAAVENLAMRHAARRRGGGAAKSEGTLMAAIFNVFPLILIPVLIYNIWAFIASAGTKSAEDVRRHLTDPIGDGIGMASQEINVDAAVQGTMRQVHWLITYGDILVALSLILLFIELLKSTSTFFLIMMMSLLDVLAGVVVTIVSARRDVEFTGNH